MAALTWPAGPQSQEGGPGRDAELLKGWRTGSCLLGWAPTWHLCEPPLPQHLSPWIKSPRGHERARALGLSACLLKSFLEHLHISVSPLGLWMGHCCERPSCPECAAGFLAAPLRSFPSPLSSFWRHGRGRAGPGIVLRIGHLESSLTDASVLVSPCVSRGHVCCVPQ